MSRINPRQLAFVIGRNKRHARQRRERDARIARLAELITEKGGWNPEHVQYYMQRLGVARRSIFNYLKIIEAKRSICTCCGQLMPPGAQGRYQQEGVNGKADGWHRFHLPPPLEETK